jgi:hypothetical protein
LSHAEKQVLAKFIELESRDTDGSWNPYYHEIAEAAGSDPHYAYKVCRDLAKRRLLEHHGAAGRALVNAPAYWVTSEGIAAMAEQAA